MRNQVAVTYTDLLTSLYFVKCFFSITFQTLLTNADNPKHNVIVDKFTC
jgi:hypothetical protein